MAMIDLLKLARNTATLETYRRHQRAIRAVAQPWLTVALVAALLEIGLFLYALFHDRFRGLSLVSSWLLFVFGVSFGVAGIRAWLFRRSHPFELPAPHPHFAGIASIGRTVGAKRPERLPASRSPTGKDGP